MKVNDKTETQNNIFVDMWTSFQHLPIWVKIWMVFLLMPINMLSLAFINEPMGGLVAFLANIAMLLNLPILLYERGFSRVLAIPHIIPWTILVGLILFARPDATGNYDVYLWVLLFTNIISLLFDYPDALKWAKGSREVF